MEDQHDARQRDAVSSFDPGQKTPAQETDVQLLYRQTMQRIGELEREIRALADRNNSKNPVCSLPGEILTNIFSHVVRMTTGSIYGENRRRGFKLPWIRVTHVCGHWRTVALGCPALWTDLSYLAPGCIEFALARSGRMPLTIALESPSIDTRYHLGLTPIQRRLVEQVARLRSVTLREASRPFIVEFAKNMQPTAPLLEKIDFCNSWGSSYSRSSAPLQFILTGGTPRLKQASFQYSDVSWSGLPISNVLTTLRVTERHSTNLYRPDIALLFATLRSLPSLRVLELSQTLPDSDKNLNFLSTVRSPHILPDLDELILWDTANNLGDFFRLFRLEVARRIRICFNDVDDDEGIDDALSHLKASWVSESEQMHERPLNLNLDAYKVRDGSPQVFFSLEFDEYYDLPAGSNIVVEFEHFDQPFPLSLTLSIIRKHMNLSNLMTLWLEDIQTNVTEAEWKAMFNDMKEGRLFSISGSMGDGLPIVALLDILATRTPGAASPDQLVFPELESVSHTDDDCLHDPDYLLDAIKKYIDRGLLNPPELNIGGTRLSDLRQKLVRDHSYLTCDDYTVSVNWKHDKGDYGQSHQGTSV